MAREDKKARYLKQRDAMIAAYQLQLLKLNLREILVFTTTKVFRSKEHVRHMIALIKSAQRPLRVAMYVLSHVRLAAVIKAVARRVNVRVMVDNTQMHCNGSHVLAILSDDDGGKPSRVQVYVDIDQSYIQYHKYVIVDGCTAMHGSVGFSNHAMVSAGIMLTEDDEHVLTPLLEDFRQILNTSRFKLVEKTDLLTTKPYLQCNLAEHEPGKDCVAMDSTANADTEALLAQHAPFLPLDERASLLKR